MSRELSPGDYAYLSIGGIKYKYIIGEIAPPLIYIYPESNPNTSNALVYVSGEWRVKGDERTDYHIVYEPRPMLQPTVQYISDEDATNICTNIVLGESPDSDTVDSLKIYSEKEGFPSFVNTLMGIRTTCETIIRRNLEKIDSSLKVGMMTTQNLARWYQRRIAQSHSPTISPTISPAVPLLSKREQFSLLMNANINIRNKERIQLHKQYEDTVICRQMSSVSKGMAYQIDSSLIGRRARIPYDMWQEIFKQPLSENPAISTAFYRKAGYHPSRGDDPNIIHELGQEKVDLLLRENPLTSRQNFLEINAFRKKSYALIDNFHTDENNRQFIYVSQMLMVDLDMPQRQFAEVRDCFIDIIDTISLKLLRRNGFDANVRGMAEVDDETIKMELASKIAIIGIPMVGDILLVRAGNTNYSYMITSIRTNRGIEALSAAVPQTESEINILFAVESKEELRQKIQEEIPDQIHQINDDFI